MSGMQSNSSILYVFLLFGLIRLKNMTVQEPCPNGVGKAVIADMCSDVSATEEEATGNNRVNSVVLRAVTQQDNCYCYVTVQNHTGPSYAVYMRKYEGLSIASPTDKNCGLAIDITYPYQRGLPDETESRVPIQCTYGTRQRTMTLVKDGKLEFRSRIIDGSFTRGYCMQIFRQHYIGDTAKLKITCTNTSTTRLITKEAAITDGAFKDTTSATSSFLDTTTTVDITNTTYTKSPAQKSTTEDIPTNSPDQIYSDDKSESSCTTYIVITICSVTLNIVLIVAFVVLLKSRSKNPPKPPINTSREYADLRNTRELSNYSSLNAPDTTPKRRQNRDPQQPTDKQTNNSTNTEGSVLKYTSIYSPQIEAQQYEEVTPQPEYLNMAC